MGRKATLLSLILVTAALAAISFGVADGDGRIAAAQLLVLAGAAACLWRWPAPASDDAAQRVVALEAASRAQETALTRLIADHAAVIREIHHRVKNNLQIVYSLLDLQFSRLTSTEARVALAATRARVSALALLHRHLYDEKDFHSVEMSAFVTELCDHLSAAEGGRHREQISMTVAVDEARLIADQAVGVGLIITEAAMNARQHAFPQGRAGSIRISLTVTRESAVLIIADDGVGVAEGAINPAGKGVGAALINGFAKQIGGVAAVTNGDGATVTVRFKPQFASE